MGWKQVGVCATVVSLSSAACEEHGFIGSNAIETTTGPTTNQEPEPDTGDESADTSALLDVGGFPSFGEWWCVRAEGAAYDDEEPIVYEDDTYPEGCQCVAFNTSVHEWILDHEVDQEVLIDQAALEGELGVNNPLVDLLLELRQQIYDDAAAECVELSLPLPPNNCLDPGLFDTDPTTPEFEARPVYRGDRFGDVECIPDPEGVAPSCSFISAATSIRLVSGVYRVPRALVDGFLGDPTCLMHQGWRVGLSTGGADFVLKGVQTNDALYRMGLRTNDAFIAISAGGDRVTLDTADGVVLAYTGLLDETSFSLEVRRAGTPRLLRYTIVP